MTILTAAHCMNGAHVGADFGYIVRDDVYAPGSAKEREISGARKSTIAAIDDASDLALLVLATAPPHPIVNLSKDPIRTGDFAQCVGHPLGLLWSYSSGQVASTRLRDGALYVQTTTPVSPGNSGGGLFNESGDLIGIAHAIVIGGLFVPSENLNLFVHRDAIASFLATVNCL